MTQRRRGLGRGLGALIPTGRLDHDDHAPSPPAPDQTASAPDGAPVDAPTTSSSPAGSIGAPRADPGVSSALGRAAPNGAGAHAARDHGSGAPATPDQAPGDASYARPTDPIKSPPIDARFAEIEVARIRPNPRQPREVFDEDALAELVHSIREVGVLQPVVVRELAGAADADFELVMGERRWRAARDADLTTIPAIIRDTPDTALLRDALLENLHRAQLNPLEEAAAYDQLLHDFGCTQEQLAERVGKSRPQVSNTLRLLRLPPSIQRRLAAGVLGAGHARALLSLSDPAAQERLAQRSVAEGLSVRSVEEIVAMGDLGTDPRPTAARTRRPVAPALADLAARLSDRFETRVRVDLGRRKGKIVLEFATIADLERIVAAMDPGAVEAVPRQEPSTDGPARDPGPDEAGHPLASTAKRYVD